MPVKSIQLTRPVRNGSEFVKPKLRDQSPFPSLPYREEEGRGVIRPEQKKEKKEVLDEIMSLASNLDAKSRKDLLAQLALHGLAANDGDQRDSDMWANAVYDGLVIALGGSGEGVPGPATVRRLLASPSAWGPVASFMRAARFDTLKVTERQAVYQMLAKLVIQNAKQNARHHGIPLSVKFVGSCSANISGIFDQSFPGYLASGLALIVARRLIAPENQLLPI